MLPVAALLIALVILVDAGGQAHQRLAPDSAAARGLELWRRHNCAACHSLYGLGGHIGPDLTNVARRRDEAYLRHVLRYGLGGMPPPAIDAQRAAELIAYLRQIDGLGVYPLGSPDAPVFGIVR